MTGNQMTSPIAVPSNPNELGQSITGMGSVIGTVPMAVLGGAGVALAAMIAAPGIRAVAQS